MKLPRLLKRGFTMIELLIVIAVLGILAVAVLAAINPIEQINRGRDTGSRSDAEQLLSAIDRYYASKGYYPWMSGAASLNTTTDSTNSDLLVIDGGTTDIGDDDQNFVDNLSTGGASEIKASFVSRVTDPTYNPLYIYNSGVSSESTYLCFVPKSASFREEAWNRCSNDAHDGLDGSLPADMPAGACPDDGTCSQAASADLATGCYICLP